MGKLESKLNYEFKDKTLLIQALTHSSYANENPGTFDNERLELLGDSVLGLIISDILYRRFLNADEGELTQMRSALVKQDTLASIARGLGLSYYMLLGRSMHAPSVDKLDSVTSSTFEAVIGAVYWDGGHKAAFDLVSSQFEVLLSNVEEVMKVGDPKSRLQDFCQKKYNKVPRYKVIKTFGPEHDKTFKVEVWIPGYCWVSLGKSKKEAEKYAATGLLNNLK